VTIPRERYLRYRPRVHLQPPTNWVNDPNGPIFWQGRWHLFYQHNPAFPGFPADMGMSWGHAVSDDLVEWEHLPIAISPEAGGPDASGCWSGSVVARGDGSAAMLYSTGAQSVCLATSRDADLRRWSRHAGNPVIAQAPEPWERQHFRDPFVFRHQGSWAMCLAGQHEGRGVVWLLRSDDLERWRPVGPLLRDDPAWPWTTWRGVLWECPTLVQLGERWALLVGAADWGKAPSRTVAFVGAFDGERFIPASCELHDHGPWYAPIVHAQPGTGGDAGRAVLFGWIPEASGNWIADQRTNEGAPEQGWAGMLALPHELSVDGRARLTSRTVPELARLRDGAARARLDGLGDCVELRLGWSTLVGEAVGVECLRSPDGDEGTRVVVDPRARTLTIDRSRSTLAPPPDKTPIAAALDVEDLARLELHLVVDRSVVHVIANGRVRITARVYPSRNDSIGWAWIGQPAERVEAWPLRTAAHQRAAFADQSAKTP
jgi:beta-fructofuranosidase